MAARGLDWFSGPGAARRYLLAIAFLAPIVMTRVIGSPPLTHDVYELPKAVLVRVLAAAALLSWTVGVGREGSEIRLSWWFVPTGVVVGWTALATTFSRSPATSLLGSHSRLDGFVTTITYAVIAFVAVQVFSSAREIGSLVHAVVASGLVVSAYAVLQILGLDPAFYFSMSEFTAGRVFSTLGNPVFLGGYLLLLLPLAVVLGLEDEDSRWRGVAWTTAAATVVAILATSSRTAWLAATAEVVLLAAVIVRKRVRPGRVGVIAAGVTAFAAAGFVIRSLASSDAVLNVGTRLTAILSPAASDSAIERLMIARVAWRAMLSRPLLGYGPERFVVAFRQFRTIEHVRLFPLGDYVDNAHSVPLQIAATAGVVAALAWVVAAVWPLVAAAPTAFSPAGDRARVLFAGVWVAAAGYCAYLLAGISIVGATATFWILLAVLAGSRAQARTIRSRRALGLSVSLVVGALLLAAVVHGTLLLAADNRYMAARMYPRGDVVGDSVATVREAIALSPGDHLYRRDLALQLSGTGIPAELDALNAVLAIEPDDVHLLLFKAQIAARNGDSAEAARILQRANRLAPTDPLVERANDSLSPQR